MNAISQTFRVLDDDPTESWVQRCIRMMEVHCPRLMRIGGPLSKENRKARIPESDRILICELAAQGMKQTDIAARVGCAQSTVGQTLKMRNGIEHRAAKMQAKRELIAKLLIAGKTTREIVEVARCDTGLITRVRATL